MIVNFSYEIIFYFALDEKRGGKLRALCVKNPRALPCMNALGGNQNSNLMW